MRLTYRDTGSGSPLILLHGMFGDHQDWAPVIAGLAQTQRVIALDLPGCGDSEKPQTCYDRALFIGALDQVFVQCGIPAATLVGNSFGAQIAMLYALQHPQRVVRLLLIAPGGFYSYSEAERAFTLARMPLGWLSFIDGPTFRSIFEPLFVAATPQTRAYLAKQQAKPARPDWPQVAYAAVHSTRLHTELCFLHQLTEFRCPVRILWGQNDALLPVSQGRAAIRQFPDAQLIEIENCGHLPQIEKPQRIIAEVRQLMSTP